MLTDSRSGQSFTVTNVYDPQGDAMKIAFIHELRRLNPSPDSPWILAGDFNLVRWVVDRPNANPDWNLMDMFNDAIRFLQLFDVPLRDKKYTWTNKQPNPNFSKIDRVLLNPDLMARYHLIHLNPGPLLTSDHIPLILHCSHGGPSHTPQRLERFWFAYDEFKSITDQAFHPSSANPTPDPIVSFQDRLTTLHTKLRLWHKCSFSYSHSQAQNCKTAIAFFDKLEENRPLTQLKTFVRIKVKERAYELAINDETKWHQRARCRWLRAGDRNTRYFHTLASSKSTRKHISKILHNGSLLTDTNQITEAFSSHYRNLLGTKEHLQKLDFSTLYPQRHDLSELQAPFSSTEVHNAVRQLASNKASSPDGLPNEFIKLNWPTLQPHIMLIFNSFYSHHTDLSVQNDARIVLVPKLDSPTSVTDFRPISVINLLPKLLSKVLANRVKPHMQHLVSQHQTAFVHGRFIAENFLATREVLHHVARSRSPALLLKLDFAKAFDTVDWAFLLDTMAARGFPSRFMSWILQLLTTSKSTILVNGQFSPPFVNKRGLRQGDPLSPYLFIIVADVLQQMTQAISLTIPHNLSPRLPMPIITFQYADDTILIVSAKGRALHRVLLVTHCFAASSGLKINFRKSSFVPIAVPHHLLPQIETFLGCPSQNLPWHAPQSKCPQ